MTMGRRIIIIVVVAKMTIFRLVRAISSGGTHYTKIGRRQNITRGISDVLT
jgi:hypothetical protein